MCTPSTAAISSAFRPSSVSRACPGAGRGSPAPGPLPRAAPISTARAMPPVPQHQPSASIFPACLPPQPSSQVNNPSHRPFAGGLLSLSIDLPNGGNATIQNNVIEQGPYSQNNKIIIYGEEAYLTGLNPG